MLVSSETIRRLNKKDSGVDPWVTRQKHLVQCFVGFYHCLIAGCMITSIRLR